MAIVFDSFKQEKKTTKVSRPMEDVYGPDVRQIQDINDTAESLKVLNDDSVNEKNMSAIDLRSKLSPGQIISLTSIENLVTMNAYPLFMIDFCIRTKRNWCSDEGWGRKTMIDMVSGKREAEVSKMGVMDKVRGMFGVQPK